MIEPGGWLYKCGHFNPSDFVQVALCQGECYDCKYAKELLKQAIRLRKSKKSQEPIFKLTHNSQTAPRKRIPNCKMGY